MDKTTEARLISRLLWISLALIAASAALTLAGQPVSFWNFPQTAIRFDALPIHSSTNPMFDFFLDHGWVAYLSAVTIYGASVWLLIGVLPKRLALIAEFTLILGLCFSETNWIAVRWHASTGVVMLYCAVVAIALAIAVMPFVGDRDQGRLRWLCWVMTLAMGVDCIFTLIGQPASYWQNPLAVHEANPLSKYFLEQGWWAYAAYILAEIAISWLLVLRGSPATRWAIAFGMALGGFCGGSNWLFYVWRLGLQAPILYGLLLSIMMVLLVFKSNHNTPTEPLVGVSLGLASSRRRALCSHELPCP